MNVRVEEESPCASKNGIFALSNKDSRAFIYIQSNLHACLSTESVLCILEDIFCKNIVMNSNYKSYVEYTTHSMGWIYPAL